MSRRFWDEVAPLQAAGREWVEVTAGEEWGPYLEEALAFAGT